MKNTILIISSLFLFCFTFSSSFAQEKRKDKDKERDKDVRRIGIKGGMNFSKLITKDADNTKILNSFNLGVYAKLPVAKHIALQPELYYTPKGGEITYKGNVINGTALFNFRYLEVPLMIVVNITDNFNVQIGPYASFLLSSKVTNVSDNNLFDFEKNIDASDNNKLDIGIAIGAGIDVSIISLGFRYNYGFNKVVNEKTFLGASYTIPDAHNGVINFYISLSLKSN